MEVGEAVTYVDPNGITQDALVVRLFGGKANLIIVNKAGGDDYLGKSRADLMGIQVANLPGCCCKLDGYKPPKTKKKKATRKKKA